VTASACGVRHGTTQHDSVWPKNLPEMAQPLNVKAQLVGSDRLDKVVVSAGFKGSDLVIDARSERENQQERVSQRWRRMQLGENGPA